jgi:hypothetical protein
MDAMNDPGLSPIDIGGPGNEVDQLDISAKRYILWILRPSRNGWLISSLDWSKVTRRLGMNTRPRHTLWS